MNTLFFTQTIPHETAMLEFGQQLVRSILALNFTQPLVIYLNGDLGAGKTTLSRGIIQALGHRGQVKSPTYTLVEEYALAQKFVYHFDLYRLSDPEELEFMGIRDYFSENTLCLIEWAEKGENFLPAANLLIQIDYQDQGRNICLQAQDEVGQKVIESFIAC